MVRLWTLRTGRKHEWPKNSPKYGFIKEMKLGKNDWFYNSTEILTYWLSAYIFLNINGKRGLKYSLRLKNFLNKIPSLSTYYHNVSCIIYLIFHIFHILILRGVLVHCSNYFSSLSSSTFFFQNALVWKMSH